MYIPYSIFHSQVVNIYLNLKEGDNEKGINSDQSKPLFECF
jgi:hypothetical protein